MPEEIGKPFAILHIRLATGKRFDMLRVNQQERAPFFENVVDGMPKHAPHNVAKSVIDWEYTIEILRSDLRTYLRDPLQASPPCSVLSHEGACSQGPGALHVPSIPTSASASGGHRHV
jgi:hypothetical protein